MATKTYIVTLTPLNRRSWNLKELWSAEISVERKPTDPPDMVTFGFGWGNELPEWTGTDPHKLLDKAVAWFERKRSKKARTEVHTLGEL